VRDHDEGWRSTVTSVPLPNGRPSSAATGVIVIRVAWRSELAGMSRVNTVPSAAVTLMLPPAGSPRSLPPGEHAAWLIARSARGMLVATLWIFIVNESWIRPGNGLSGKS